MNGEIPFYSLSHQHEQIKEEVQQALNLVFDSDWYVLGEQVSRFEQAYAQYIGVKYCIGVGNGLDALKISLKALGIGPGDEVIVPANTYIATVLAVTAVGAVPVLVEPDSDTYNIHPANIEAKISSKTKAIIPVHLYGLSCKMDVLSAIATAHDLYLIEDNAQASGAVYQGRKTGNWGHVNAHSFYPTKNLGALGDGGAITTNDDELAYKVRLLRNYGSTVKYHNEVQGYNSRLDEIQAAVLNIKLRYLDQWVLEKKALAGVYNQKLSALRQVQLPDLSYTADQSHAHHLYVIKSQHRDALAAYLKAQQINTLIHYPIAVYKQKAYAGSFSTAAYPITDRLTAEVLSLPIYPGMSTAQVLQVTDAIARFKA